MNNDLISRSELKKALEEDMKCGGVKINEFDKGYDLGIKTAIEMLDNAPTVNAVGEKIIRCIDCKYYHPFKHWCDCHEDWAGGEDGFCSLAERKEE